MNIACPQCGAHTALQDPAGFARCAFCGSSLVLDLGGVRPHLLCVPRHAAADALPLIRAWCDQRRVPVPSSFGPPQLVYRPFWRYPSGGLIPAWATIERRWRTILPPEGAQQVFAAESVRPGTVIEPTVAEAAVRPGEAAGDLIHLPFYDLAGVLYGRPIQLAIDACTGHIYPEPAPAAAATGPGASLVTVAAGFFLMFLEAVAIPHPAAAGAAISLTGVFVYWAMRGLSAGNRQWA